MVPNNKDALNHSIQDTIEADYGSLIEVGKSAFEPQLHEANPYHWMVYSILFLLAGIAAIVYLFPERIVSLFSLSPKTNRLKTASSTFKAPGLLIGFFFFLNYLAAFCFFLILFIKRTYLSLRINETDLWLLVYVVVFVGGFYIYRLLSIRFIGFLFNTQSNAKQQAKLFTNTDNAMGVMLIPMILLMVYNDSFILLVIAAVLILVFHFIKWFQTVVIGISNTNFSVFHLILYLCTLEIIPLLILFRTLENGIN